MNIKQENQILKKIFLILAILLVSASSLLAQGVFVVTEPVVEKSFHDQITLVGRTSAIIESRIVSEVSGRVAAINSTEGIWVKKNSPLITIDSEKLKLSLEAKAAKPIRQNCKLN